MASFHSYLLREIYKKVQKHGDKLAKTEKLVDWEKFRLIIKAMYRNKTHRGGRPNIDEVIMMKLLVLQAWYGLSDPELERQVADRISFQHFLGFPETVPDYSTVWRLREHLAETGRDPLVWEELQRQLNHYDVECYEDDLIKNDIPEIKDPFRPIPPIIPAPHVDDPSPHPPSKERDTAPMTRALISIF